MSEIKKFPRGAKPTPRHKLAASTPFRIGRAVPLAQVAYVPAKLSMWGNDTYGDCVTASEAFNKSVSGVFISDNVVEAWASKYDFLNGAMLPDVMDQMAKSGFPQDNNIYGDGGYTSVDYSNEPVLQAALAIAPVKIGIDANALPSGAGNQQGWFAQGGSPEQYTSEDHCVELAGYGPAAWLFQQLKAPLPAGVDGTKVMYLLFTWSTIGVVDHAWIMSTVAEAWLRNPSSTVNGVPLPNPGPLPIPPTPPTPPVPPTPVPPVPSPSPVLPWYVWAAIGVAAVAGIAAVIIALSK